MERKYFFFPKMRLVARGAESSRSIQNIIQHGHAIEITDDMLDPRAMYFKEACGEDVLEKGFEVAHFDQKKPYMALCEKVSVVGQWPVKPAGIKALKDAA